LTFGSIAAQALVPYTSYTYDVFGEMTESPHAYVPHSFINSETIAATINEANVHNGKYTTESFGSLGNIGDIFVDDLGHLYLADITNNRIVCLDENYNLRLIVSSFVNENGVPDSLEKPQGVYVTKSEIFVADTGNSRIVIFDKLGNFQCIVSEPDNEVIPDKSVYTPVAVSVDKAGRIYVVSSTTNYGVISMNRDSSFNGFIGAQKVTYSLFQYMWRMFQTDEQLAKTDKYVPTEYNNLTIDKDGFIYVTTDSIDEASQINAITSRSKTSNYAPIKKLNPSGTDVLVRGGFYPPSGEVTINSASNVENSISGPSKIVDVALGPSGTWSIIDKKRSKVFTYDEQGNLLYIFGDVGTQLGQINTNGLTAIAYQGTKILLLDYTTSTITVYKRTAYGDLIVEALQSKLDREYDKVVDYYIEILRSNNNFDSAYIGIAQSYYQDSNYGQAMDLYKYAYDTTNYSAAFTKFRKEWIEERVWMVPVFIVVVAVVFSAFSKYRKKVNLRGQKMKEKRTLMEEFLYVYHIMYHPFDGFWDLKHEKRGSVKGATLIFVLTVLGYLYNAVGQGYLYNPYFEGISPLTQILSVVLPVALWVISNWCLTTLFDGEGSLKDVYITTCYALMPAFICIVISTILSNVLTLDESTILGFVSSLGLIWSGALIFFGMMVIHDYSIGKNIITSLGTIVGMALIMFIGILFTTLIQKVFFLGYNIYVEISYRM
jgi:sugar lactone lactonase YvrE/tetratricopeptide (TPR) repeat protein